MKETDPNTTSPETNPMVEPETSNPFKDRIRRVRISSLKKDMGIIHKDFPLPINKTVVNTYLGNANETKSK